MPGGLPGTAGSADPYDGRAPPGDPKHALAGARDDERRAEAAEAALLRQQRLGAGALVSRAALLVPALGEHPFDLLDGLLEALDPRPEPLPADARRVELPLHVPGPEADLEPPSVRISAVAISARAVRGSRMGR